MKPSRRANRRNFLKHSEFKLEISHGKNATDKFVLNTIKAKKYFQYILFSITNDSKNFFQKKCNLNFLRKTGYGKTEPTVGK